MLIGSVAVGVAVASGAVVALGAAAPPYGVITAGSELVHVMTVSPVPTVGSVRFCFTLSALSPAEYPISRALITFCTASASGVVDFSPFTRMVNCFV